MIVPTTHVETAFRGPLLAPFRHQADGVWPVPQGDFEHLFRRRHFKIERTLDALHQKVDVGVPDMATVFPQVGRDAVCPGFFRNPGSADRIGMIPAPRISDGRDMVDIHP
jgi:hypothetical protein